MKRAYIDVETTGLFPYKNGLTQIAIIIEMDNQIVEQKDIRVCPFKGDEIEPRALEVQGRTEREIMSYPEPEEAMMELETVLGTFVDKFNKNDKLAFVAYNAKFDEEFMRKFFYKCGNKFFGSWFWAPSICAMQLAMHHLQAHRAKLPNFKLETICTALGLSTAEGAGMHDALTDIILTRQLYQEICKYTKWEA